MFMQLFALLRTFGFRKKRIYRLASPLSCALSFWHFFLFLNVYYTLVRCGCLYQGTHERSTTIFSTFILLHATRADFHEVLYKLEFNWKLWLIITLSATLCAAVGNKRFRCVCVCAWGCAMINHSTRNNKMRHIELCLRIQKKKEKQYKSRGRTGLNWHLQ